MYRALAGLAFCFLPAFAAQQPAEPSSGIWLDVPFIKQTEEGCGSASLAMVLQYWSAHGAVVAPARADVTHIQKQLYARDAHGIFASDMQRYLRESGFREFAVRGEWNDLVEHLRKGRPLIASIQPGSTRARFHYVVVTGVDWQREAVFINDPARGKLLRIERQEFEKEWQPLRNWMLLAVPTASN